MGAVRSAENQIRSQGRIKALTEGGLPGTLAANRNPGDEMRQSEEAERLEKLRALLRRPTGMSSAGYPYFERRTFEEFRDGVAFLFDRGARLLEDLDGIEAATGSGEEEENLRRSCGVARQIVRTAAITAPTDLWLLRHILGVHHELGLTGRLVAGEALHPEDCRVEIEGEEVRLNAEQLAIDLDFLLSRGFVEEYDGQFRIAGHPRVSRVLTELGAVGSGEPVPATPLWRRLFLGEELTAEEGEALRCLHESLPGPREVGQNHWVPTVEEILTGYLLVPVVLGLRAANVSSGVQRGERLFPEELSRQPELARYGCEILFRAGWVVRRDGGYEVTHLGERGLTRGPGPFGIIQTYVSYMKRAKEILLEGRGRVWVRRGENIGASQDANRGTFRRANDALDRYCEETGFSYSVFIEHAIGRGEATRQRFARDGEERIRYFGADLEDAAIDAAEREQEAGRLPSNMEFIRQADIGKPEILIDALRQAGVDPRGAVMLVGNGFHEVRDQTDEKMVEVFKRYHDAGILLVFTEENALSVDDLRATAWNTYHAGFKYVHEKSGQCLRPASPRPRPRLGPPLRAAWSECASQAGYERLERYSTRTRTIYPYPRPNGQNPSISVSHFFVPTTRD
jgi:hypothetical protein